MSVTFLASLAALAWAQDVPRVSVRGALVDAEGRPAAGARVALHAGGELAHAESDAAGVFEIDAPALGPQDARLEAAARDGARAWLAGIPACAAPIELGTIRLLPTVTLRGRVVAPSGAPVPGARVFAALPDGLLATAAGQDGRFALDGAPAGPATLGAEAPGFGDEVRPGAPPGDVELRLRDEAPLDGVVVGDDGAPIAGARVECRRRDARRSFWRAPAETDAQGRFSARGLDADRAGVDVRVARLGFVARTFADARLPLDGVVRLKPAVVGELRATRGAGGAPATIRSVQFESLVRGVDGWRRAAGAVAAEDREALAPDRWRVSIPRGDVVRFVVVADDGARGRSGDVTLPIVAAGFTAGASARWTVAVEPPAAASRPAPARVSGRVTIGGAPPGERVRLLAIALDGAPGVARLAVVGSCIADADGRYAIDVLAAGRVAIAPLRAPFESEGAMRSLRRERPGAGALRSSWVADAKPGEESHLDVDAARATARSVAGVVTIDGLPAPGVAVTLLGSAVSGGAVPWGASASTDDEGRYACAVDGAGAARLEARGEAIDAARALQLAEGQSRQVHFDVERGAVSGALADPSGRPLTLRCALQGAREAARDLRWRSVLQWIPSDAAGRFTLPALAAGRYRVLVFDPARRYASIASEPFEMAARERRTLATLVVPRAASVHVSAREADGGPATGRVTVRAAPDVKPFARLAQAWLWARPRGIVIHGLPPGAAVVTLSSFAERAIALSADGETLECALTEKLADDAAPPASRGASASREMEEQKRWDWGSEIPELFEQEDLDEEP